MTKNLSKIAGRLFLIGLGLVLILTAISNLGLFRPNWPFELFATFMRQILVVWIISIAIIFGRKKKKLGLLFAVLAALAFWPLISSSKYLAPESEKCADGQCYTAIFANLRRQPQAFNAVKKAAKNQDVDIIALSELPPQMTKEALAEYLTDYPYVVFYDHADDGRRLGSTKGIASRLPLGKPVLWAEDYPRFPRSIIHVPVKLKTGDIDFYLTHPRIPLALAGMRRRDSVISMLGSKVGAGGNFVFAGDFNLAPWTPAFQKIPGQRAGDPRFQSTWKDGFLFLGAPIDHFFLGEKMVLTQAVVLSPTGSDHRPILIEFSIKAD